MMFYKKKKTPRKLKHPAKVHVWAGISMEGATHIVLFSGIMSVTKYGDISAAALVPLIHEKYPNHHRLIQGNPQKQSKCWLGFLQLHSSPVHRSLDFTSQEFGM